MILILHPVAQIKFLKDSRPKTQMCLLAETSASRGQYQKLNPVVFQPVDESMRGEDNSCCCMEKIGFKNR